MGRGIAPAQLGYIIILRKKDAISATDSFEK